MKQKHEMKTKQNRGIQNETTTPTTTNNKKIKRQFCLCVAVYFDRILFS